MEYNYFGNTYQVSEVGVVTSHLGRVLSHQVCRKGYHRVVLLSGRKHRLNAAVHRLVALCYVPNLDNKLEVNHKDGDKDNNHFSNLEWCTTAENIKHAINNGLITSPKGFKSHRTRLTPEILKEIHSLLESGVRQTDISARVGVSQPVISQIKRKVRDWY